MQNFFELFQLPRQFNVNLSLLEANYRAIQSATHPDRFVTAPDTEKLIAMQAATNANEAYQTLKNPTLRGAYLLSLQGISALLENNTAMPADFLMQQMEWREAIEDNANNLDGLHHLLRDIKRETADLHHVFGEQLDNQLAWEAAAETLRKLQFMDKLREEINRKIEVLED